MLFTKNIINRLNKLLKDKKITQRKLAIVLNVHEDLISKWKLRKKFPSKKNLDKLELFLNKLDY